MATGLFLQCNFGSNSRGWKEARLSSSDLGYSFRSGTSTDSSRCFADLSIVTYIYTELLGLWVHWWLLQASHYSAGFGLELVRSELNLNLFDGHGSGGNLYAFDP